MSGKSYFFWCKASLQIVVGVWPVTFIKDCYLLLMTIICKFGVEGKMEILRDSQRKVKGFKNVEDVPYFYQKYYTFK